MAELAAWQYVAIGLIFVWGGFVRSGLGFGGAALTMPLLMLILDSPVVILPIIAVHLLFFGALTLGGNLHAIDWPYLRRSLLTMMPGKLIGVFGLLTMPGDWLILIIYAVTAVYAFMYVFGWKFHSHSRAADAALLNVGGYISGTSLTGAPLIITVYARNVARENLRATLFVLWIVLVLIKLGAFVATGTDLQLIHHLWLLPCAAVGHVLGLRLHQRILELGEEGFMRWIGGALLLITVLGVINTLSQ
ncbi:MAG: TSUP family transporter [Gammaproteobacteria bacterium]